jgi:hypothetical protein
MNDVLTTALKAVKMKTSTDGPVFRAPHGESYRNFRTVFEHTAHQASLEDFTFHDLWHTSASRLVMAMALRSMPLSTDHKQRAVSALEHFGAQVPTMFIIRRARRALSLS